MKKETPEEGEGCPTCEDIGASGPWDYVQVEIEVPNDFTKFIIADGICRRLEGHEYYIFFDDADSETITVVVPFDSLVMEDNLFGISQRFLEHHDIAVFKNVRGINHWAFADLYRDSEDLRKAGIGEQIPVQEFLGDVA